MRYCDSIFGHLLKPISRRRFEEVVDRHAGNAYDKDFKSWDHLAVLIYAQLTGVEGLRGLKAVWNANSHHHYHLGVGKVARSTMSDANARRPPAHRRTREQNHDARHPLRRSLERTPLYSQDNRPDRQTTRCPSLQSTPQSPHKSVGTPVCLNFPRTAVRNDRGGSNRRSDP